MKIMIGILLLVIAIIVLVYLFFNSAQILIAPATQQNPLNSVCLDENCFFVELAKTPSEQEKGLMNRSDLGKDKGMLFIFNKEGIYPFWMKNTLISLDIIWIDGNGKVVFISQNVQPCKSLFCLNINPTAKAKYVLEINGGASKNIGLNVGDELEINIK